MCEWVSVPVGSNVFIRTLGNGTILWIKVQLYSLCSLSSIAWLLRIHKGFHFSIWFHLIKSTLLQDKAEVRYPPEVQWTPCSPCRVAYILQKIRSCSWAERNNISKCRGILGIYRRDSCANSYFLCLTFFLSLFFTFYTNVQTCISYNNSARLAFKHNIDCSPGVAVGEFSSSSGYARTPPWLWRGHRCPLTHTHHEHTTPSTHTNKKHITFSWTKVGRCWH